MSTKAEILTQVAEGKLSPADAATLLDHLEQPQQSVTVVEDPLRAVAIHCRMGAVEVVGDPNVREAVAEGEHVARREGDRLVIDVAAFGDIEDANFRYSRGGWGAWFPWGYVRQPNAVKIRVRPDLDVNAEVEAGTISLRQLTGALNARVSAGSCTLEDFRGTFDVRVQAGSFKADALLDHGSSRINCEAGSAKVQLQPGSSVRITAQSTMGSLKGVGGEPRSTGLGTSSAEAVVGAGAASLDIESKMGSVKVIADE